MTEIDYREMYVSEALEHVETINQTLLELESNPNLKENIDLIFRSVHTIKGMAATMGYEQTRDLCMNIETIFDKLRKEKLKISSSLISAIFKCLDLLQQMISDQNKKVDLKDYLMILENPENVHKLDNVENSSATKSPTIRVKMEELDSLVNLVGELVISKMRLEKLVSQEGSEKTNHVMMEISRLVTDLQYQSLKIRLVPIDQVFGRFTRLVRNTSQRLGKEVNLIMEGSGIELDRTILDAITDPLLHILRNSVDHGIETPNERQNSGKPSVGKIYLTAYRIGDKIGIKIQDDGNGINLEKIKSKAVENGLISKEEAHNLSKEETINLVGMPGLSTAQEVNDISGRGVGMDVVIKQVEEVGGTVKISSEEGKGTTIILYLPLSVSIIGGLLVKILGQKFVLPLSSVATTIKISSNDIKSLQGIDVFTLRDEIVPVIQVGEKLGIQNKSNQIRPNDSLKIVIVKKNGKSFGLLVDSFERKQEIVIKKINGEFHQTDSFSNATILPDGRVALILDPSLLI